MAPAVDDTQDAQRVPNGPALLNPAARLSLIAGLLSWLPGVGLIAIFAGLIGGTRSRDLNGVGRGQAFTGVVLGIAGLMLYAVAVGAFFEIRELKKAKPAFERTQDFVRLVGSGQVNAVKGLCTDAITEDRLTDTAEAFQKWGVLTGEPSYGGHPNGDGATVEVTLPFDKTTQRLTCDWVFIDGRPRLNAYHLEAAPATQPGS